MRGITVCALCALKAFVAGREYEPTVDESPREHLRRLHPDPVQSQAEHDRLLPLAEERVAALMRAKKLADMRDGNEFN